MYEGCLQHDAQEVLQCILGYVQEACDTIRKEQGLERDDDDDVTEVKVKNDHSDPSSSVTDPKTPTEEDGQVSGKRKSDTEAGNAKKKTKSVKSKKSDVEGESISRNTPLTRSKRKSSSDLSVDTALGKDGEQEVAEEEGMKKLNREEEGGSDSEGKGEKTSKEADGKRKKRAKLSWLRPSGKQPSIFSKFRSVGKISSTTAKNQDQAQLENVQSDEQKQKEKTSEEHSPQKEAEDKKAVKPQGMILGWFLHGFICYKNQWGAKWSRITHYNMNY